MRTVGANSAFGYGHYGSIALPLLAEHLPPGYDYHCLRSELVSTDEAARAQLGARFAYYGAALDFQETAALCECLDLIITVDTSIAHLSGSLGRPTWILLPFNCDWRWLEHRTDTPWYPSARLYHQDRSHDWRPVLAAVTRDLLQAVVPATT